MYFNQLPHAQAEALAMQWLASEPARLEWLSRRFPSTVLDYSDASMRALLRESNEQFELAEAPGSGALPLWCEDDHYSGYRRLSDDSLWLVDALALYLGDLLISRDPIMLRWGVHCSDKVGYQWHHHPCVVGYRWPYSTFEDIALFAVKAAKGKPEDPQRTVAAINFYLSVFKPLAHSMRNASDGPAEATGN